MIKRENKRRIRHNKLFAGLFAAAMVCTGMAGCGNAKSESLLSNSYETASYANETAGYDAAAYDSAPAADYEMEAKEDFADSDYGLEENIAEAEGASSSNTVSGAKEQSTAQSVGKQDSKKIIKRYNYSYETERFDEAQAYLKQQIDAYDGYISSSEVYGSGRRSLYLTARIPAENSDQFVGQLGSLGTMVSQSESAEDITLQYTDTESRIASLKTEQERLLALLDKADSLETIVTLEDRLTEVRYELENYESQRKLYDDLVTYSTVTITLEEVTYTVEVDDSTFLTRITTGLEKSFRDIRNGFGNFLVGLIVALPYLAIWGFIIFLIVWIIRSLIKRQKRKRLLKKEKEKEDVTGPEAVLSLDDAKEEQPSFIAEDIEKEESGKENTQE
ncbi:MAG: DUF4349 domain-containing protein [Lachnospiraceae bacterium]|nr:DUF4349 domain-containing protein [Lachnospiraceae bacterium]